MAWQTLAAALAGYLVGSIPFGYLVCKLGRGEDIRTRGSGNIGATNVLRSAGLGAGALTLVLDAGKGYLAVELALRMVRAGPVVAAAALMVVIGHIYPLFLSFRGGKGVATGMGAFLAIHPLSVLICAVLFAAVAGAWRYVSLASMTAVAAFPLILLMRGERSPPILGAAVLAAALILYRHSSNLKRLRQGREARISSGGAESASGKR